MGMGIYPAALLPDAGQQFFFKIHTIGMDKKKGFRN
jgi:hypothetical protein